MSLAVGNLREWGPRKIVVPAVSKFIILILHLGQCLPIYAFAPSKTQTNGSSKETKSCRVVSKGPKVHLNSIDPKLETLITSFIEAIKNHKPDKFKSLFHKKTKVKADIGDRILSILKNSYKKPWDVTVFRVFALNNMDGDKSAIHCKSDQVSITPIFGYKFQVGAWIQIMAQNELARLYLATAPTNNQWKAVGLHIQQWTFEGMDHEGWINTGLELAKTNKVRSHMSFDVAQKLLFGGDFLTFDVKHKILEEIDLQLSKTSWLELANQKLGDGNIVYIGTLLAPEGLGILLRYRVDKQLTMTEVQKKCRSSGNKLLKLKWLARNKGGIRCEYILPREDPDKEGILGSQYFTYKDLSKVD